MTSIRSRAAVLRRCVTVSTLIGATLLATPANAEGWLIDGELGLSTGLEGGDDGAGEIEWRRARTRVSAGVEMRSDEVSFESTVPVGLFGDTITIALVRGVIAASKSATSIVKLLSGVVATGINWPPRICVSRVYSS